MGRKIKVRCPVCGRVQRVVKTALQHKCVCGGYDWLGYYPRHSQQPVDMSKRDEQMAEFFRQGHFGTVTGIPVFTSNMKEGS